MPRPSEWITVWVGNVQTDLSTATIEACDDALKALRLMHMGEHKPFKGGRLDDVMYKGWCDVVLDRRLTLAREAGPLV